MEAIDGAAIRHVLLEVVADYSKRGAGYFQSAPVLNEAARRLGVAGRLEVEQALLTFWYDLFRQGYLAWGYNLANPEPPFVHLTSQGSAALKQFGRDPANPAGYLAHLSSRAPLNPIAHSYIDEALGTYNAARIKAAAVMVGAASESLILEVKDTLVARLTSLKQAVNKDLADWRVKRILDGIKAELDKRKASMPKQLQEAMDAYWPAFTQQIRVARNEAGHPASIDPVSESTVHASLLIFPELADLANKLNGWINSSLK